MIHMKTSYGTIVLELDAEKAPVTVENFLRYAREGFYDGTIFHRVIDGFVIQGGGFGPDMVQKPTHNPIQNEAMNGLRNARGTVAMARTSDPNSATSQFFINVVDNDFLNYTAPTAEGSGYCVFGKVVDGLNTLEQIRGVPTASRFGFKDVPIKDVVLEKVEVVNL
ncbi:MAG: peptidylprolyl isomerase [Gammaproteobacteria bacterium]|nr:peptidylprolyl isomerase [Gammaproteobacteria bacterium]